LIPDKITSSFLKSSGDFLFFTASYFKSPAPHFKPYLSSTGKHHPEHRNFLSEAAIIKSHHQTL
jgi:hypothetical protein